MKAMGSKVRKMWWDKTFKFSGKKPTQDHSVYIGFGTIQGKETRFY